MLISIFKKKLYPNSARITRNQRHAKQKKNDVGNQLRCFCHVSISDVYIENNYLYFTFAIRA